VVRCPNWRPRIEVALLSGFAFECRPDCGLCCYASPRIERTEIGRLLQIAPEAQIVEAGADRYLAARPHGGACQFLADRRCGVHAARPSPCREFPVSVHVGERLQASVVLSCPGLDLRALAGRFEGDPPGHGLTSEIQAAEARVGASTARRLADAQRRRRRLVRALESEGRWQTEEAVRRRFVGRPPLPTDDDFPVADPPEIDSGWEDLPLFFDGRATPVALAATTGGWELHELAATGGSARALGVIPPPTRRPRTTSEADRLLGLYLEYWLRRDAFFGSALLDAVGSDRSVEEVAADELHVVGAQVLARAEVRAKLRRAGADPLGADDVADGIRAVDQDWLDRPTWGDRL
jgi:Fe-S-cluster containining protein